MATNSKLASEKAGLVATIDFSAADTAVKVVQAIIDVLEEEHTTALRNYLHQMTPACNRSLLVELDAALVAAAAVDAA